LGRGVGVVLVILFVILTPLALVLFDVQRNLLQPDIYKSALAEQRVYEQLPTLIGEQILRSMTYNPCEADPSRCEGEGESGEEQGQGGPPVYFASLSQQDWEVIFRILVPTSWLREQGESAIDQAFAFLDSDAPTLEVDISMTAIRDRLTGPEVGSVLLRVLRALPQCTPAQKAFYSKGWFDPAQPDLPACRPPEEDMPAVVMEMGVVLNQMAQSIPDEVTLDASNTDGGEEGEGSTAGDEGSPFGSDPKVALRLLRQGMRFGFLVPLLLLLLIVLFAVRSLKGWLLWWGASLAIAGAVTLVPALAAPAVVRWALETRLRLSFPSGLSETMADTLLGVIRSISQIFAGRLAIMAGILMLVGVAMLVAAYFVKAGPAPREEEPAIPE
jgi:hypothetical protein